MKLTLRCTNVTQANRQYKYSNTFYCTADAVAKICNFSLNFAHVYGEYSWQLVCLFYCYGPNVLRNVMFH